jgi:diguanylate cyclase (GGDEF)-like protein
MRSVVFKSGLVTLVAMVASVGVAAMVMNLQGFSLDGNALLLSFLCPLFVAWPASAYNYWQKKKLTSLHDQLAQAHDDLARAHRSLADAHARLAMRASRDAMTGLLNRESFFQSLEDRHREGHAGHLLIIDADHFKAINDTHGHSVGDAALVAIAAAITRASGDDIIVGRIGGEEFAVCIPATCGGSDRGIAEAIRAEIEGLRFLGADGTPIALSVSIGSATFAPCLPVASVFQLADKRLYAAKRGGRNSIVTGARDTTSAAA